MQARAKGLGQLGGEVSSEMKRVTLVVNVCAAADAATGRRALIQISAFVAWRCGGE